jgi:lipid A ethanolaminephosphotransferase
MVGLKQALARLPSVELQRHWVFLWVALYWAWAFNAGFLNAVAQAASQSTGGGLQFVLAMWVLVVALHAMLVALGAWSVAAKPLIMLLTLLASAATFYTDKFGVYMDPSMVRNVLRTDASESVELISVEFVLHMTLYGLLPCLVLWRVRWVPAKWWVATSKQLAFACLMLGLVVISVALSFKAFSSLMRNQTELRYLITPANVMWSTGRVVWQDAQQAVKAIEPIGEDARLSGAVSLERSKPLVVVLVVGETARAANWGLNGYARNTTPKLQALGVQNVGAVTACGTNTEVSLPCMFAPVGRRNYDEKRIRSQQSLLHVLNHAGVGVHWYGNQPGCKGVCTGLPSTHLSPSLLPEHLCQRGRCMDEGLWFELPQRLDTLNGGVHFWVFHQLGSHGPSYFRRYPEAFKIFTPECLHDELSRCSIPEIVNSYDNTLLYTDHVLADGIRHLKQAEERVDSVFMYVSDHGESLGENGLFLHGMPYRIAPAVQKEVPWIFWGSKGFAQAARLDPSCMQTAFAAPVQSPDSHDQLFHTVLGLLDVKTSLYEPLWDRVSNCR